MSHKQDKPYYTIVKAGTHIGPIPTRLSGGCIRPASRGLTSGGGTQGGDTYTDLFVVIMWSIFNLK